MRLIREYKGPRQGSADTVLLPGTVRAAGREAAAGEGGVVLPGPGHERRRARRMLALAIVLWAVALVAIAGWIFQ